MEFPGVNVIVGEVQATVEGAPTKRYVLLEADLTPENWDNVSHRLALGAEQGIRYDQGALSEADRQRLGRLFSYSKNEQHALLVVDSINVEEGRVKFGVVGLVKVFTRGIEGTTAAGDGYFDYLISDRQHLILEAGYVDTRSKDTGVITISDRSAETVIIRRIFFAHARHMT